MLINKETGIVETDTQAPESKPEPQISDTRITEALPSVMSMASQEKVTRDYLAIGVVSFALILLMVACFYLIANIKKDFISKPFKSVSGLLDEITEFSKFFIDDISKSKGSQKKQAQKARKHMRRGYDHYKDQRFKEALTEYSNAVKLDPINPDAYFWRARTLIKMRQFDKALTDLQKSVKLNPRHSKALDNLGWIYMMRGEYDESISYLNKSIQLQPDNGWAHYTRGHIYLKIGDRQKGLIDAEKACKMGYQDGCKIFNQHKDDQKIQATEDKT
jgi:tetratricopeptide (TPR) repeat protein